MKKVSILVGLIGFLFGSSVVEADLVPYTVPITCSCGAGPCMAYFPTAASVWDYTSQNMTDWYPDCLDADERCLECRELFAEAYEPIKSAYAACASGVCAVLNGVGQPSCINGVCTYSSGVVKDYLDGCAATYYASIHAAHDSVLASYEACLVENRPTQVGHSLVKIDVSRTYAVDPYSDFWSLAKGQFLRAGINLGLPRVESIHSVR